MAKFIKLFTEKKPTNLIFQIVFLFIILVTVIEAWSLQKTLSKHINAIHNFAIKENIENIECSSKKHLGTSDLTDEKNVACARKKLFSILAKLGNENLAIKKQMLLYIPKTNKIYWKWAYPPQWCYIRPLIAPMLTGIPLINGLQEQECYQKTGSYHGDAYGYASYRKKYDSISSYSNKELCVRAKEINKNITTVIIIDDQLSLLVLNCTEELSK